MAKNISEIIARLKLVTNEELDANVAKLLGMNENALYSHKNRQTIPYKQLSTFCEKKSISLDWLLTGAGEKRIRPVLKFGTPESELYGVLQDSGIKDSSELKKALELWKVAKKQINPDEDDRL
jgi:hypothetical protein